MFNVRIQRDSNNVSWGFRMQGKWNDWLTDSFSLRIFRRKRLWCTITNSSC